MNITGTKKRQHYEINGVLKRKKNGECAACLKYSVSIFVEQIFKTRRLEVSCAVRRIYTSLGAKGLKTYKQVATDHLKAVLDIRLDGMKGT